MIAHKLNKTNHIFFDFYDYYNTNGVWSMIIIFLKGLIVTGFIVDILEFIILEKLTPNYIIIIYEIGRIPFILINFVNSEDYETYQDLKILVLIGLIILSILQVITLLFYLEIFEFNFCSLNKNTKKNIEERERLLSINNFNTDEDNESDIEINEYKISNIFKTISIEMSERNSFNSNN